ncbi:MAG TPA: hypothetical protein VJP79_09090 [Nitrososphaera sp.]|nr:hypothetical protein [Nitrososphaera sp.]
MVSTRRWGEGTRFFVAGTLLILLLLVAVAPNSSAQGGGYGSESLFIALFSNGDALVEYDVKINDPLAEETRIKLFAESSITNLIVVDYEDNVIDFEPGRTPNEIVLKTPAVANARISYSTQDLVDKTQGRWKFSLNSSSIGFAVKLPPDSVLIDPGENFPTIKPFGDQQVLTFKPGDVRFVYVIGVLGTEEQANIVIRLAETTIEETTEKYPGINLTAATALLSKATEARDDERFPDAESLAGQANDAAVAAARDYEAAQAAITDTEGKIRQATEEGRSTALAEQALQRARTEFDSGDYTAARDSAEDAASAIGSKPEEPQMPLFVIVAAVVAAGGGVGAMLYLRSRKPSPAPAGRKVIADQKNRDNYNNNNNNNNDNEPSENPLEVGNGKVDGAHDPVIGGNNSNSIGNSANNNNNPSRTPISGVNFSPPHIDAIADQQPPQPISSGVMPATVPESQTDKSVLSRIVGKIVEEKPHLRPEDQDVLRYLADKEGAAFESEIRTKFQLPKTTIWRLVKRLEREELVEIRKAGGQNLIKLKFENRQP